MSVSGIVEALAIAGYKENIIEASVLNAALEDGFRSSLYRSVVGYLVGQLHNFYATDECVHMDSEVSVFQLELSGFLKEMMCPFGDFVTGPISDRFPTAESRLLLLEYLTSELMAAKMCRALNPSKVGNTTKTNESQAAKSLKDLTTILNGGNNKPDLSTTEIFNQLNTRLAELLKTIGPAAIRKPLFNPTKPLTEKQWLELERIQADLDKDYCIRRELLLARLDCTIQSFQWSDRLTDKKDAILSKYSCKRRQLDSLMGSGDGTNVAALLAARDDLAIIEKTACASVRANTKTRIQKHIIGQVPDRGGRANEVAPPPPEMPSWQKNRSQNAGGGRGRGGGGERRGRGGHGGANQQNFQAQPQGNFQATLSYNPQGSYQQSGYQNHNQSNQFGGGDYNQNTQQHGGRVQGGWSQRGYGRQSSNDANTDENRGNNGYHGHRGGQQRRGRGRGNGQRY